jgi:mono/diheme cytochrome c family protein/peptidoglycan hydrolase CwlO-like protein
VPKPTPTLYSVEKTFVWFAVASLILTFSLIFTVGQDYAREWKNWQRKFVRLKYEKTEAELTAAKGQLDREKLKSLEGEYEKAKKDFKAKKPEYRKLHKEASRLEVQLIKARTRYNDVKQYHDSYRYFLEEYQEEKDPEAAEYKQKLQALEPQLEESQREVERLEKQKEGIDVQINELLGQEKELQKEIERLTRDIQQLERTAGKIKPDFVKALLNAPMLDFLHPTLQIQQVVVEDLYDDYHFSKVQKVDRCTTCHLGIDQKGFEEAPQPFRTHPKLELFLGGDSPHPLEKFGCTVCHGGNGHSLTFKDTAHEPQSEEQGRAWEKKYGWHRLEKWAMKMLPLNHVEASCAKCHRGVLDVPQAEKLNQGRRLAVEFGCTGCHKIEGFERAWKVGPNLSHAESKLTKEWIVRWLQDPKAFRPATRMPKIFHLSNVNTPEDREKSYAAIEGIATYLLHQSKPLELEKLPEKGDPKEGERLVKEIGCLGCHSIGEHGVNRFAPDLSGLGSKTTADWLYTWLKNPKHYNPETQMPRLRLNNEEAADITSYLLTLKNEAWAKTEVPRAKPEVVDDMVIHFLRGKLRREEAQAELGKMDEEAKLVYLGEKMIGNQGCFACHQIAGFEEAKPVGTELTNEGAKEVERLDFGFTEIERTRQSWFFQKLKEPRVFDHGRIRDYFEKLRMPQFDFTDEEAERVTTFLLSLTEEFVPLEMQKRLDLKEEEMEAGRWLIAKLNCQGCHLLEGQGGRVKELLEDPGLAPPPLDGEGAKVHEAWLYRFLKSPTTIRPWIKYRMPTFDFTDGELKTVVDYFHNAAKQEIVYERVEKKPSSEMIQAGKKLFEMFQCIKCHQPTEAPTLGASFLAPDLTLSRERLKPGWVAEWLKDPQALQPGTMMPAFFPEGQSPAQDVLEGNAAKQIEAIRDYLMQFTPQEAASFTKK